MKVTVNVIYIQIRCFCTHQGISVRLDLCDDNSKASNCLLRVPWGVSGPQWAWQGPMGLGGLPPGVLGPEVTKGLTGCISHVEVNGQVDGCCKDFLN